MFWTSANFSFQRLPVQTPANRRLRCWQVMPPSSIRWRHIHRELHLHHWSGLQNQNHRTWREDHQITNLGHSGAGAIQNYYIQVTQIIPLKKTYFDIVIISSTPHWNDFGWIFKSFAVGEQIQSAGFFCAFWGNSFCPKMAKPDFLPWNSIFSAENSNFRQFWANSTLQNIICTGWPFLLHFYFQSSGEKGKHLFL